MLRSVVLRMLPQGNWLDHSEIQIIVEPGSVYDEATLKEFVLKNMELALLPRKPRMYSRKNWTGQEDAICDIALMDDDHDIR